MPNLFGIDIAGLVSKNIGPGLPAATLTKITQGSRTTGSLTGGANPTSTAHSCKAVLSDYNDYQMSNTVIQTGDRKVLILTNTISGGVVPAMGDKITIEGATYNIIRAKRDPAAATYECQVRG